MVLRSMRLMVVLLMHLVRVLVSHIHLHIALVAASPIHYVGLPLALIVHCKGMRRGLRHGRSRRGRSIVAVWIPTTIDWRAIAYEMTGVRLLVVLIVKLLLLASSSTIVPIGTICHWA